VPVLQRSMQLIDVGDTLDAWIARGIPEIEDDIICLNGIHTKGLLPAQQASAKTLRLNRQRHRLALLRLAPNDLDRCIGLEMAGLKLPECRMLTEPEVAIVPCEALL